MSDLIDSVGMFDLAAALPEQVASAARLAEGIEGLPEHEDIENVVVSYRINSYLFGDHADIYPELPMEGSETERRTLWKSYIHILQRLAESGKRVVLVLQAPELPQLMEGLIYDPMLAGETIPGLSRKWWRQRNAYVQDHLRDIPAGVTVIDPAKAFCDKVFCYAAREDVSLYFDDDHLSIAGASIVAADVLRKLGFPEHPHASAHRRSDRAEAQLAARLRLVDEDLGPRDVELAVGDERRVGVVDPHAAVLRILNARRAAHVPPVRRARLRPFRGPVPRDASR